MNRSITATIVWTFLVGLLGATLFFVKHEVKDLESKLASVNRDIERSEENIHVLNAEWSFLNDPARLRDLAERHLGMHSMAPNQMATLDTLTAVAALAHLHHAPATETFHPPVMVAQANAPLPEAKPAHPRSTVGGGLAMATTTASNGEAR